MLITIFICVIILLLIVGGWFILHASRRRPGQGVDSEGCAAGSCGDSVEIRLGFKNGTVAHSRHRTAGCAHSFMCLKAATELAEGRTPEGLLDISAEQIEKSVGGLPPDHRHCADIAVAALHAAAGNYLKKI